MCFAPVSVGGLSLFHIDHELHILGDVGYLGESNRLRPNYPYSVFNSLKDLTSTVKVLGKCYNGPPQLIFCEGGSGAVE